MPCLLKKRTEDSPGVIIFTHNEVLNGVVSKSKKLQRFLDAATLDKRWIFGVHIQGDCSHLSVWPRSDWQSFLMWSNPAASFLKNIPTQQKTEITCINFLPKPEEVKVRKKWDICIISRPAPIKNIKESLLLIRELFALKEDLSVVIVAPDPREQSLGNSSYKKQDVDRSYFELPIKIFTCKQLKQISFITSSQASFGTFPIANDLIADLISGSKFLLLTSRREGVPRVIAESLIYGTPCIVSADLVSGVNDCLNEKNSVMLGNDICSAAKKIKLALDGYGNYLIDQNAMQRKFCETYNVEKFKSFVSDRIKDLGCTVEGEWVLHDLHLRLACHGQKQNIQFMNDESLFFNWLEKVENSKDVELDEDYFFDNKPFVDQKLLSLTEIIKWVKLDIYYPIKKLIRAFVA